jgi:ATP-dependent DNA ligase
LGPGRHDGAGRRSVSHVVAYPPDAPRLHAIPRRATAERSRLDHEIKHDGYRLMAHRDAVGARLLTRNGIDWSYRFPLIAQAVGALRARSCLIDGEAS